MNTNKPNCLLQVPFRNHVQESYESASGDARLRAKQLRKSGFRVVTESMGMQVTGLGLMRLTLLTAYGNMDNLPQV
jgi:hypothetical protein